MQPQRIGLPVEVAHVFRLGVIAEHMLGLIAAECEHEQVAGAHKQVLDESAGVEPGHDHLLNDAVQLGAILLDDRVDRLAEQCVRRETEQRHGGVVGDVVVHTAAHELVEHRKRVSHRPAARTRDEPEHTGLGLDVLLLAYMLQIRGHDLGRHQTERVVVSA